MDKSDLSGILPFSVEYTLCGQVYIIKILIDDNRRFAPQLERAGRKVLGSCRCDDPTDSRAACEENVGPLQVEHTCGLRDGAVDHGVGVRI